MQHTSLHTAWLLLLATCAMTAASPPLAAQTAASFTEATFAAGSQPVSSMLQAQDGNYYGVTNSGGTGTDGTIYQLSPAGVFTTVYNFTGTSDGGSPAAGLAEGSDGALYGTTTYGGANGLGTVFRFTSAGVTTLHSFDADADGSSPYAALTVANDGRMYGILAQGPYDSSTGNYSGGTIFSIAPNGTFQDLYQFPEDDSLGAFSTARLLEASDGNFWGVTSSGGASGYGTLFQWSAAHGLSLLHNFTLAEGSPVYGLAQSGSTLYGVTFPFYGGQGEIFSIALSNQAYNVVYTFTGASDGGSPATALYPASDGNLYGTTQTGGTNSTGTFFRLSSTGVPTTLLNFPAGSVNTFADAALVEGSNLGFYLPLLYDAAPNLPPSTMDGAGSLLLLQPQYTATPPPPVALLSTATSVAPNQSFTLSWNLPNAASLTAQQCVAFSTPATAWTGQKAVIGSQAFTLSATGSYVFALNCGGSQSSVVTVIVSTATQTTLSAPASVQQGQSATLTASVTGNGVTPTGTVQFIVDGSLQLKTASLVNGAASFSASTKSVPVGSYSVQALYSGDANHSSSKSASAIVHVTSAVQSTATALTASPQSVTPGQRVTLTATVTSASGTPAGSVNFYYRTLLLGTAALHSGVASLTASTSSVPAGTYGVDAVYGGSPVNSPSTSPIVKVTVQ